MLTYVRARLKDPEALGLHRFASLGDDHPAVGEKCPLCEQSFAAGDATTLVALGPGADREEREKCAEGRHYNALAILLHWSCATGRSDDERREES